MITDTATETAKNFFDGMSVAAVIATFAAWLPPAAAFVSLVWGIIRIYETKTVQGYLKKRRKKTTGTRTRRKSREETPDTEDD